MAGMDDDPLEKLDARVVPWPIGAKDAQHPHAKGWAGVRHHIHNRGDQVGLSVHVFGT